MHEKELQLPIYTTFSQNNIIYKKKKLRSYPAFLLVRDSQTSALLVAYH